MSEYKVLICEDEENILKLMGLILKKQNYAVYTAHDGKEALDKAKELTPDVILLDIRMPKLDGIEVARQIRKTDTKMKIIFLTGFESPQISQEASRYDIFDYIVKPISPEKVIEVVAKAVGA